MAAANRTGNGEQKSEHLKELEDRLEEFIEMLRSVGVIAGDFQSNGQAVLNERINGVVDHMKRLDRDKHLYSDVHIPLQVLNYVDESRNPELFTQHQLEKTLADHQAIQRKVQAYKDFRDQLLRQLEPVFPNEIAAYLASSKQKS